MRSFDPKARDMARNRGQILYRYRPSQTFDHPGGYTAQVRQYGRDDSYQGFAVDPEHLVDEAMRFVRRWRVDGANAPGAEAGSDRAPEFPEDDPLARTHYEVVIPGKVYCRFWPLVFRCGQGKTCGRAWESREEPQPGDPWPPACPSCNHREGNRQLQFVFVHACGEIEPMRPPQECANHHRDGFRLNDEASRFQDFRWECLRCRTTESVRAFCSNPSCRWTNKMMSPQVHTASAAYVGHGRTLVNPPGEEFAKLSQMPQFAVVTLARWLGACSDEDVRRLLATPEPGAEVPAEVLESIKAMEEAGLAAQARALRRRFVPVDVDELGGKVEEALGFDPLSNRGRALAANVGVFDQVLRLPRTTLTEIAHRASAPQRKDRYARYRDVLLRAGFDAERCMLIDEFPVMYLATGFSRGGFGPGEADLVAYKGRAAQGQAIKTLLFANPTVTEALVFALDRARVARWLVANGAADDRELADAGGVSRWFASKLDPEDGQIPRWDPDAPLSPGDPVFAARLLFGLLHSMAHQMLRAVAVDSGFSETALSEYLFPYDLAFAIHPNGGSEFTIGGLRTVLEQNLDDVVRRAIDNASCLYDPNCMIANRGADHGCLQLPETACQAWNRFISRWDLYGSPDSTPPRVGYWDPAVDTDGLP